MCVCGAFDFDFDLDIDFDFDFDFDKPTCRESDGIDGGHPGRSGCGFTRLRRLIAGLTSSGDMPPTVFAKVPNLTPGPWSTW